MKSPRPSVTSSSFVLLPHRWRQRWRLTRSKQPPNNMLMRAGSRIERRWSRCRWIYRDSKGSGEGWKGKIEGWIWYYRGLLRPNRVISPSNKFHADTPETRCRLGTNCSRIIFHGISHFIAQRYRSYIIECRIYCKTVKSQ